MKILFITGLYPNEWEGELSRLSSNVLQNAANVFQWSVVDGLVKNNADFEVVSLPFLPAFPNTYKQLFTPKGDITFNGRKIGTMLPYCNLLAYKTISMTKHLKHFVKKWLDANSSQDQLVLLTYSPYLAFINALKDFKRPNVQIASIVTDLVDDTSNFSSNRTFLKRIQCRYEIYKTKLSYSSIDKFILLSKAMEEKIPQAIGRNIVVEGISIVNSPSLKHIEKSDKYILYTGSLEKYSCVDVLIDAFSKLKMSDIKLVICGSGFLETMIKQQSKIDNRIDFRGTVSRDEAVKLQQYATLLINPRMPNQDITKYSFPSKTMEYMTSGTPMIGYRLEGIPHEYYNYFYTVDSIETDALTKVLYSALSKNQTELNKKAQEAFNFIKNNKSSQEQIKKILIFLKN